MQIQKNQMSFQGVKANKIRERLIEEGKGIKVRQIPGMDRWIATMVPVEKGKLIPVSKEYVKKATIFPYMQIMIGKTKTQAMFKRIREIMKKMV